MNLVSAPVLEEGKELVLGLGGNSLILPEGPARKVRALGAGTLLFGIRPEHIRIATGISEAPVTGTVEAVENLGRETLLQVRVGDRTLSVLTEDKSIREGDTVALDVPLQRAHFFRKESEL